MEHIEYRWNSDKQTHTLRLALVRGTSGSPYTFGETGNGRQIEIGDFFISTTPVTQALWAHVMGSDISPVSTNEELPVVDVSWNDITQSNGFLSKINQSSLCKKLSTQLKIANGLFRLPSETEWEYAAKGGSHWHDGFQFSGSNEIEEVAWHDRKHGDHRHPVEQKAPNRLGLYDMSGNVWEWCQDIFTPEVTQIPQDGHAYMGAGNERVLRGGCFHNWAIHCTVSKRYAIGQQFKDECIGFRIVFSSINTNS